MYVFRGNPFHTHSLEQSYHPTQPFKQEKYNTKSKIYMCKNNIKLIYLTFIHCTCKFKNINSISLIKTMNKLSLIKIIKKSHRGEKRGVVIPTHLEKAQHVMCMCVLRHLIVFLRIRCSICVRCIVLILLIKLFIVSYPTVHYLILK